MASIDLRNELVVRSLGINPVAAKSLRSIVTGKNQ